LGLTLDEPKENEKPVQVNGIDILVEDRLDPFIKGTTIDYVKNWYSEGFRISKSGSAC
jgi:Fe-S cluster assembly iron-binding protein IscA